jgi:hypothetical protein
MSSEVVAAMEGVLALSAMLYDARYPTVCHDEKAVVLHADVRPGCRWLLATLSDGSTNISGTVLPPPSSRAHLAFSGCANEFASANRTSASTSRTMVCW